MFVDAAQETLRLLSIGAGTGALDVDDGVIYLSRGRVTYAECPRTPDLETRLVRSGSISAGRWQALAERSVAGGGGLRSVIRQVRVPGDLLPVMRSTVLDAASVLVPGTRPFAAAVCRYHPGKQHWAGDLVQWEVEELLAAVSTLADAGSPGPDDVPAAASVRDDAVVFVEARDWALLNHIDGRTSVAALAWRHGLQLAGARAGVHRLLTSGAFHVSGTTKTSPEPSPPEPAEAVGVEPPAPDEAAPRRPAAQRPEDVAPAEVVRVPEERAREVVLLPRREVRVRREKVAPGRPHHYAPPRDPALLQRVLEGLRRMA